MFNRYVSFLFNAQLSSISSFLFSWEWSSESQLLEYRTGHLPILDLADKPDTNFHSFSIYWLKWRVNHCVEAIRAIKGKVPDFQYQSDTLEPCDVASGWEISSRRVRLEGIYSRQFKTVEEGCTAWKRRTPLILVMEYQTPPTMRTIQGCHGNPFPSPHPLWFDRVKIIPKGFNRLWFSVPGRGLQASLIKLNVWEGTIWSGKRR